jgi:hypothetical protein
MFYRGETFVSTALNVYQFSLLTLARRPHAPALSDPLQRQGRLSPQARRDANLPRIAFAAALQVAEFACGRKPFC